MAAARGSIQTGISNVAASNHTSQLPAQGAKRLRGAGDRSW